jgi:hypoxanthine phosphoribosyltransferase
MTSAEPTSVRIGDRPVRCLIGSADLARRVQELGRQISADYADRPPLVVGILKGAWVFMADLVRQLSLPVRCDFVKLSSYGTGIETSGAVRLDLDLSTPAEGEHILLVEDIVDTGLCVAWLLRHLQAKKPASVRLCALLDKPARRQTPISIDYIGFTIPDHFVVGYGIDCAERHRELPYVGHVLTGDES